MKVKRIWFPEKYLVPQLQPVADKSAKKKLKALRDELRELLTRKRFICFNKQPRFYFDNQLNCLWLIYGFQATPEEMFAYVGRLKVYAFQEWELPTLDELQAVRQEPLFAEHPRLKDAHVFSREAAAPGQGYQTVTLLDGRVAASRERQTVVPVHRVAQRDILSFIVAHALVPTDVEGVEEKLRQLYDLTVQQNKEEEGERPPPPSLRVVQQHLLEGDYLRARLPVLEPAYLTDMGKGLWELHQPQGCPGPGWSEVELEEPWEARNPEMDVREGAVAIDFGTSSSVVACREQGRTMLLRVGMNDLFQPPTPQDYQNPTVLAFINLPNLLAAWRGDPYRPLVRWDDFHFSHEALNLLRRNEADQRVVGSVLTGIKQWPLAASHGVLRITDQATATDLELRPFTPPLPVRGEAITVSDEDPFDPIELYAYYLGLFINNRSNGLFLDYTMTFPVTYPREVKQRILASFARGLQRSFPQSFVGSDAFRRFSVQEEASEPAAYAACALEELTIAPSREGTAFAVFDFGGGSTDFDFGLYRLPNDDEAGQGYERVIEHFGASGDMYLGGENLVANLAYLTFQHNLDVCRERRIPFACPQDADRFPGHELFIDDSFVARTNSALLAAHVRTVWEKFKWSLKDEEGPPHEGASERRRRHSDLLGDVLSRTIASKEFDLDPEFLTSTREKEKKVLKINVELLNRERERVEIEFRLERTLLNHFLVQRVGQGLNRFFIAMGQAFGNRGRLPEEVHVLLAGNASRSILVQALFAAILQEKMVRWLPPSHGRQRNPVLEELQREIPFHRFVVHRPPVGSATDPYKPTAKTGVAIGLLKLIPGETLLAIGPQVESREAPFRFFVGYLRNNLMIPVLEQNGPYHQWRELGVPTRGVFNMVYSTSPQAGLATLPRGSREMSEQGLRFPPGTEGKKLYVQAVDPFGVELCLADSLEQITKRPEEVANRQVIKLR